MLSLNPREEKRYTLEDSQVLVLGKKRFYGKLPKTEIWYTDSVTGAIFWLYKSGFVFDELWLNEWELVFNHHPTTIRPIGGTQELRTFFSYLEEHPVRHLKTIRIGTINPVAINYVRQSMKRWYQLSYNLPKDFILQSEK